MQPLPIQQRQLCWAHLIRDLTAIAKRPGATAEFGTELLALQQQPFSHCDRYKVGTIPLAQSCLPIRKTFEAKLHQLVIQRKISHGVQSASGTVRRSRLLTVTTTPRQQGRDVWRFLEQAWIGHHRGGVKGGYLSLITEFSSRFINALPPQR